MKTRRILYLWGIATLFLLAWWMARSILTPLGGSATVYVMVPRGSSAGSVSRLLAERGVIRSPLGFRLLARVTGKTSRLKPGAYKFSTSMTPMQVLDRIAKGEVTARWVTFPEGFTVRQIADRLAAGGLANKEKFLELALGQGSSFRTNFDHPGNSLEGYLFPDTYLIPSGASESVIISEMLKCFERKVAVPYSTDIARSGWTLHDVLTLASLIEREARVSKDRPLISGVLRNRLGKGMRLECDATVLYALGEHKDRVLYRDLEVDSPYNTYRYAGLPPGPIANPGLNCIEAALHPAQSDYLYYVARPNGSHIFTRTLEEHNRARLAVRGGAGN
jgi:UPF0755 protein